MLPRQQIVRTTCPQKGNAFGKAFMRFNGFYHRLTHFTSNIRSNFHITKPFASSTDLNILEPLHGCRGVISTDCLLFVIVLVLVLEFSCFRLCGREQLAAPCLLCLLASLHCYPFKSLNFAKIFVQPQKLSFSSSSSPHSRFFVLIASLPPCVFALNSYCVVPVRPSARNSAFAAS